MQLLTSEPPADDLIVDEAYQAALRNMVRSSIQLVTARSDQRTAQSVTWMRRGNAPRPSSR